MAFGNPAGRKGLLCGKILGGRNKWSEELWWGSCNSFWFTNMGEVILPLPSSFLFCTPKQMVSSAQQSPWKLKENTETAPEQQETVMGGVIWQCVTWQISRKQHLWPMSSEIPQLEISCCPHSRQSTGSRRILLSLPEPCFSGQFLFPVLLYHCQDLKKSIGFPNKW